MYSYTIVCEEARTFVRLKPSYTGMLPVGDTSCRSMCACVRACVRPCVRARVCACVRACMSADISLNCAKND